MMDMTHFEENLREALATKDPVTELLESMSKKTQNREEKNDAIQAIEESVTMDDSNMTSHDWVSADESGRLETDDYGQYPYVLRASPGAKKSVRSQQPAVRVSKLRKRRYSMGESTVRNNDSSLRKRRH